MICHSDFDGLVCGILLTQIFKPDYILITEPNQLRDGKIQLTKEDIVADLPIPPKEVFMAFDHHSSVSKEKIEGDWFILDPTAPSCARVIYDTYKKEYPAIKIWDELVKYCDKIDSGNISLAEYLDKNPYNKISLTLSSFDRDLDKFYMQYLIRKALFLKSFEKLSQTDWVEGRYKYRMYSIKRWKEVIGKYVKQGDEILVIDTRNAEEFIPKGNSWELNRIYPDCKVIMNITQNREKEVLVSMYENMFNKKSKAHLGDIAARYRGGGHKGAAGFALKPEIAEESLKKIMKEIKEINK